MKRRHFLSTIPALAIASSSPLLLLTRPSFPCPVCKSPIPRAGEPCFECHTWRAADGRQFRPSLLNDQQLTDWANSLWCGGDGRTDRDFINDHIYGGQMGAILVAQVKAWGELKADTVIDPSGATGHLVSWPDRLQKPVP